MSFSVNMVAPSGFTPGVVIESTPSGANYFPDQYGFVTVTSASDVPFMVSQGFRITTERNSYAATRDPVATDDSTQDIQPGSAWTNSLSGVTWRCVANAASAAVWVALNASGTLIGRVLNASFNKTTDTQIPLFIPATAIFRVQRISVTDASVSLTTAAGGVYDGPSKTGNAIVAAGQVYSALTAATKVLDLTIAAALREPAGTNLYLSLTTAQGAAANADVYVYGDILAE